MTKAQGVDLNQVLVRFALERILYRMTQSQHADRCVLKGALLFTLLYDILRLFVVLRSQTRSTASLFGKHPVPLYEGFVTVTPQSPFAYDSQ